MSTSSQQASAVEAARKIVTGAVKPPRVGSSEAKLFAEQLADAAAALREREGRNA